MLPRVFFFLYIYKRLLYSHKSIDQHKLTSTLKLLVPNSNVVDNAFDFPIINEVARLGKHVDQKFFMSGKFKYFKRV